jgi:hypothetical protein
VLRSPPPSPICFKHRDDALRLIADACRITDMAKQLLEQYGPYLMPRGAQAPDSQERVRTEQDCSMWRRALDLTGFKQLMDAQAVAEFEKSLGTAAPEFTESNIRATFIDLRINAESMFHCVQRIPLPVGRLPHQRG